MDDDVESGVKGFLYNIEESEMGKKGKRASRATATVVAAVPVSLGPREWLWRKVEVIDDGPFAYWIAIWILASFTAMLGAYFGHRHSDRQFMRRAQEAITRAQEEAAIAILNDGFCPDPDVEVGTWM